MEKLFERFKNLNWKEVIKMKKLIIIAAALAVAFSFLPKAEAADTAELGLSVTFKLEPLKIWSEPEGPFTVEELQLLKFEVIGEDLDTLGQVSVKAESIPEGAEWIPYPVTMSMDPRRRHGGTFKWTPKVGQSGSEPYIAIFKAICGDEEVKLEVKITVKPAPVISIELEPTTWALRDVKMGEKRDNLSYFGSSEPIHHVKNTGNVIVGVDIRYGALIASGPQPGTKQGLDTFITGVGRVDNHVLLEPNGKLQIGVARPTDTIPLWLTYGAPTALSAGIKDHGASYELRAYPEIIWK